MMSRVNVVKRQLETALSGGPRTDVLYAVRAIERRARITPMTRDERRAQNLAFDALRHISNEAVGEAAELARECLRKLDSTDISK
jgi:hypothetical protein